MDKHVICISANVPRTRLRGLRSTQQPGVIVPQHKQDMVPLLLILLTSLDEAQSWPVLRTLAHAKVPALPSFFRPMLLYPCHLRLPDVPPTSQLQPSLRALSSSSLIFWTAAFKQQGWSSHIPLPASQSLHLLFVGHLLEMTATTCREQALGMPGTVS